MAGLPAEVTSPRAPRRDTEMSRHGAVENWVPYYYPSKVSDGWDWQIGWVGLGVPVPAVKLWPGCVTPQPRLRKDTLKRLYQTICRNFLASQLVQVCSDPCPTVD